MSALDFSDDAVERLEALNRGADVVARHEDVLRRLDLKAGERVLDIGSGTGILCEKMADIVGSSGEVRGVDISQQLIDRSNFDNRRYWLSYAVADATALREGYDYYDAVVSTQVAEYVRNVRTFCYEFRRVMKPNGRGLIIATDWDAVIWHSDHPERMKKVLKAWEGHCADPRLPRHLGPVLRKEGLNVDRVDIYPLLNLEWSERSYSKAVAGFVRDYVVAAGAVTDEEGSEWYGELQRLGADGRYFLSQRLGSSLRSRGPVELKIIRNPILQARHRELKLKSPKGVMNALVRAVKLTVNLHPLTDVPPQSARFVFNS